MTNSVRPTLVIESAIGGGSIALFADGDEIGRSSGGSRISRAEDLLPSVDSLLSHHGVDIQDLGSIVVSAGPGSFTGIRIGIATALGLSAALRVPVRKLSLLTAIAMTCTDEGDITVALSIGRDTVCLQSHTLTKGKFSLSTPPDVVTLGEFDEMLTSGTIGNMTMVDAGLASKLENAVYISSLEQALSIYLGRAAAISEAADVTEPIFAGKKY